MKKGILIGIGVAVIVAIIFGIASLPDKVLIESPFIDTSQNTSVKEKQVTMPSETVSSKEQTEPEEEIPAEPIEQAEQDDGDTRGDVIEVKIKDGVGSGDK